MGYESPIEIIMGQMNMTLEDNICKAVQNAGITVDREELLRALRYDRDQYRKGYADRDREITRCRDCVNNSGAGRGLYAGMVCCYKTGTLHKQDYYCADGKPKGSDEP